MYNIKLLSFTKIYLTKQVERGIIIKLSHESGSREKKEQWEA